jgi:hypothetical protein
MHHFGVKSYPFLQSKENILDSLQIPFLKSQRIEVMEREEVRIAL